VITDSQSARADLLTYTDIPCDRVTVVPLGVEERFFATSRPGGFWPDPTETSADRPTILHVGSCLFYKNIEAILRALPVASRLLGSPITFLKVGSQFSRAQLELIAKLGLQSQVQHLGRVLDEDLPAIYRQAHALVFPSLHEGFGLPVLEAMASSLPVIASRAGSLPEVAGDVARYVDPLAYDDLAMAIAQVLGDSALRANMGQRGRERAARFSWLDTARLTAQVYQQIWPWESHRAAM
jgi:alpha-1,3-rhamnosyl/mannosyltransferase